MASELEGVRELNRKLEQLDFKSQRKVMRAAVRKGTKPAFDRAKGTIPVGVDAHKTYKGRLVAPGFAKRSLRIVTRFNKRGDAEALLGVRKEAFYAVLFVELGTSRTPAHPWLRPAFESTKSQQLSGLAGELRKQIEKVARQRSPR